MKVLIDTNVIIDVLQKRDPWYEPASELFLMIANQQLSGCITAKEAADIYYFSKKQFRGQENTDQKARDVMSRLFTLFEIIDTLATDCRNALGINNNNYEDAIMIASAVRSGIDCIITRNPDLFQTSRIKVMSPEEVINAVRKDSR